MTVFLIGLFGVLVILRVMETRRDIETDPHLLRTDQNEELLIDDMVM